MRTILIIVLALGALLAAYLFTRPPSRIAESGENGPRQSGSQGPDTPPSRLQGGAVDLSGEAEMRRSTASRAVDPLPIGDSGGRPSAPLTAVRTLEEQFKERYGQLSRPELETLEAKAAAQLREWCDGRRTAADADSRRRVIQVPIGGSDVVATCAGLGEGEVGFAYHRKTLKVEQLEEFDLFAFDRNEEPEIGEVDAELRWIHRRLAELP